MKLMDWVILLLESDKLTVDQLQFGYQKNIEITIVHIGWYSLLIEKLLAHLNCKFYSTKIRSEIYYRIILVYIF